MSINPSLLFQTSQMAQAGMPKQMDSFMNPNAQQVTPALAAQLQEQYGQQQTQRDIAKGTLGLGLAQFQNTLKQQQFTNQLDTAKYGLQSKQYSLEAAKTGAELQTTDLTNKQKVLELGKQQALYQAGQQGPDAVAAYYKTWEPDKYLNMQETKTKINTAIIGQNKDIWDLNKDQQDYAIKNYQSLGNIFQQVHMVGMSNPQAAQKMYGQSYGMIHTLDPNAPDPSSDPSKIMDYTEAGLVATGSAFSDMAKNGKFNPVTMMFEPKVVQDAMKSKMQQQAAAAGMPQTGTTPGIPDEKTGEYSSDAYNIYSPKQFVEGSTKVSGRVMPRVASAQGIQEVVPQLLARLNASGIPVTTKLTPSVLEQALGQDAQETKATLEHYDELIETMTGRHSSLSSNLQNETPQTIALKMNYALNESKKYQALAQITPKDNNPVGLQKAPGAENTGLIGPQGKPISSAEITQELAWAKANGHPNATYDSVYTALSNKYKAPQ